MHNLIELNCHLLFKKSLFILGLTIFFGTSAGANFISTAPVQCRQVFIGDLAARVDWDALNDIQLQVLNQSVELIGTENINPIRVNQALHNLTAQIRLQQRELQRTLRFLRGIQTGEIERARDGQFSVGVLEVLNSTYPAAQFYLGVYSRLPLMRQLIASQQVTASYQHVRLLNTHIAMFEHSLEALGNQVTAVVAKQVALGDLGITWDNPFILIDAQ